MADNEKMLEWAESMALENLRSHLNALAAIKQETVITLSVLFAAMAGCIAYLGQHTNGKHLDPVAWGAVFAAIWLFAVCAALIIQCLRVADAPTPTNNGSVLYQPQFTLEQVRKVELANIDARSTQAQQRAARDSKWLNWLRMAALLTPLAFGIGFEATPQHSSASAAAAAPQAQSAAHLHPAQAAPSAR